MKLEKKIKILEKNMDLKSIFAMYSELRLDLNSISLENLSIEFVILNNISLDSFKWAIENFTEDLNSNKEFTISKDVLTFKTIKKVRIPRIASSSNSNRLQAMFFSDINSNEKMTDLINQKLNNGIAIEVMEGLFIVKSNQELKAIFGEKFLNKD